MTLGLGANRWLGVGKSMGRGEPTAGVWGGAGWGRTHGGGGIGACPGEVGWSGVG